MSRCYSYILLLICQLGIIPAILPEGLLYGGEGEAGMPLIRNYLPSEYNAGFDNWSILQDQRGLMYFGNGTGVLEFDGVSWRLIKIPNGSAVRCLAMDADGRIYVAAVSDFGYLAPDSLGRLSFISLRKYLGENRPQLGDVWSVRCASHGVYFKTATQLFRWKAGRIKIWDPVISYRVYNVDDEIYVRNNGVGLMRISGDSLLPAPGGSQFAATGVFNMLPFPSQSATTAKQVLITTNKKGLFLYNGLSFTPYNTEADPFLKEMQIYNAARLADSSFAFATQRGGVVIIGGNGKVKQMLNASNGLLSPIVYGVYPDRQGGLWLAMNDGLARVETPSPFSYFGRNLGIRTSVNNALRFAGRLYVTNDFGLSCLTESGIPGQPARFFPVPEVDKPGLHLLAADDNLLIASNGGIFLMRPDGGIKKLAYWTSNYLCRSRINPDMIYAGAMDGLYVLRKQGNEWIPGSRITALRDNISQVLETENGDLWLRCRNLGVIHLQKDSTQSSVEFLFKKTRYDYGVETSFRVFHLLSAGGEILFATSKGLKRFDEAQNRFVPADVFGKMFSDSTRIILEAVQDAQQRWILISSAAGHVELGTAAPQQDGGYAYRPDQRLKGLDLSNVFSIYPEPLPGGNSNIYWVSTADGLVRFDPRIKVPSKKPLPPLIRRVMVSSDSNIYWGASGGSASQLKSESRTFSYSDNNIVFEFAAPDFDKPSASEYQFFLQGNDKDWSPWTKDHHKEYTNLGGGKYQFRVRTRDLFGEVSEAAAMKFVI
ncbi:MAG: triple tyrosine motif-containing protein, partial [Calditrichia bacterium]